jgi:hypothetical protein
MSMVDLTFISEGNDKTSCYSFDLPAKVTCPGATELCASKCYAFKLASAYPNVGRKYLRNQEFANSAKFVRYMIDNIPRKCEFRIHVSGDFYSVEYIQKWKAIAKARPDVTFYTYTRSWRIEELWFVLMELNALSNVNVNLSVDKETGMPEVPYADDYRWCYLTLDDSAPNWLRRFDIVFRTNHNARKGNHQWKRKKAEENGQDPDSVAPLIHRIAGATVCPFERGKEMPATFSCSQCGLCVKKPQPQKVNVCL